MRKKLTKKQLDVLYECWKDADTTKERIELLEERLPKVPSLIALSIMRKLAKTDPKWLKMATRKKNKKAKEILLKKQERDRKRRDKELKKQERETKRKVKLLKKQKMIEKRLERNKKKEQREKLVKLRKILKKDHVEIVKDKIESNSFFCPEVEHFVNNIACIFRVFSDDHILSRTNYCNKCSKFYEHIDILEEAIHVTNKKKTKRSPRNKTSNGGSKDKKQSSKETKKTNRETEDGARC